MSHKPFTDTDRSFLMWHLDSFNHTFIVAAANGKPSRTYFVTIDFTMHTFTHRMDGSSDRAFYYAHDRNGKARAFNPDRWTLSNRLPDLMRNLLNERTYLAERGNAVVFNFVNYQGHQVKYEVFFKLYRSGRRLFLEAESAYVRDPTWRNKADIKTKMGFSVILERIAAGQSLFKKG